jgi:hypothetical protein
VAIFPGDVGQHAALEEIAGERGGVNRRRLGRWVEKRLSATATACGSSALTRGGRLRFSGQGHPGARPGYILA